jgi:hypothetical protein
LPATKASKSNKSGQPSGTLIAQHAVNVLDVSRGGCLLEATRPLDPGTVGTLQLSVNGREYVEDFRVARCTALSGRGSTYRIGLEFLRTRRVADSCLRHVVTHLVELNAGTAGEKDRRSAGGTERRSRSREADAAKTKLES